MPDTNQLQVLLLQQVQSSDDNFLRLCQSVGWQVESAAADASALKLLKSQAFDIVIADLVLPQPSSAEIVKMVHSRYPDQPLIVVSANGEASDAIAALREGAHDYLQLPIDALALEHSVVRALAQKRTCEESFRYMQNFSVSFNYTSCELAERELELNLIDGLWRAGKITLDAKLQIALAFQEALTNSLDHGNLELQSDWKEKFDSDGLDYYSSIKKQRLQDPHYADRRIAVQVNYDSKILKIQIQDQGPGFEPKQLDQAAIKNDSNLNCHGRGLALITCLMDQVSYSDRGRKIEMVKNLVC